MLADEKLKYIIERGNFKYAEIKNRYGDNLCNFSCNNSTKLGTEIIDFVNTWGRDEYKIQMRVNQNTGVDKATVLTLNFSDNKPEITQPISPVMQGATQSPEDIAKLVQDGIDRALKSKELEDRETTLKIREAELQTQGGRLSYVLNSHVLPGILNFFNGGGNMVPGSQPILQGVSGAAPNINFPKALQVIAEPEEMNNNETNQDTLNQAFSILAECVDADTLLLFAQRIKKDPKIIQLLKSYL